MTDASAEVIVQVEAGDSSSPASALPAKPNGRWVAGQSGNLKGRPPTRRERLLEAKQKLEAFVRGKIDPEKASRAIVKLVEMAERGDVRAAAAILPYILSKATDEDADGPKDSGGIVIRIENATVKAQRALPPIDAEVKEVSNNG